MKILMLIALIGLCSSELIESEYKGIFPLRAVAVVYGQAEDQSGQTTRFGGRVEFFQKEFAGNVRVTVRLGGLPQHNVVGGLPVNLTIQTYGVRTFSSDIRTVCASTGPVFNPTGDSTFNGVVATFPIQQDGTVTGEFETNRVELFGPYSGLGRAVSLQGVDGCGVISLDESESGAAKNGFFSVQVDPTPVTVPKNFDLSAVLQLVPPDFWQKNGIDLVRTLFPKEDLANMEPRAYAFLNADLATVLQRATQRPEFNDWFTYLVNTITQHQQNGVVPTLNTLLTPAAYETLRRRLFKTQ